MSAVGFQTNEHPARVSDCDQSISLKLGCKPKVTRYKVARMHPKLLAVEKSWSDWKEKDPIFFYISGFFNWSSMSHHCRWQHLSSKWSIQPTKQNSYSRISTFKWASASSSWLELEGEGVADLLPGGEGEPWGSAPRLTCRFSCVSALMGLGSIGGELFIRAWLRL